MTAKRRKPKHKKHEAIPDRGRHRCYWCTATFNYFPFSWTNVATGKQYTFCTHRCRGFWETSLVGRRARYAEGWKVRLEFKRQDLWIGVFWKPGHVWICLLPMLPIHFTKYRVYRKS